jgi:hypothetical protein
MLQIQTKPCIQVGPWCHAFLWQDTNISEVDSASIFRVELVSYRNTTPRHNPEELDRNLHRRENLKTLE